MCVRLILWIQVHPVTYREAVFAGTPRKQGDEGLYSRDELVV
jgi:hypothetical protein